MLDAAGLFAAAALAASPALHVQAPLRAAALTGAAEQSSNWAGYAITAQDGAPETATFTDVTGTWTAPRVSCRAGSGAASAFWVGLGGFSNTSEALEQVGTSADCLANGRPSYYAWYELVPFPAVMVHLYVRPGDRILGAVAASGEEIVLELKNLTRRTHVTKTIAVHLPDLTSAEWIAEAPSLCTTILQCDIVPLAKFGSVTFGDAGATGGGHMGTITDTAWQTTPVVLVPDSSQPAVVASNRAGAAPSKVTEDGRAFTVTWGVTAAP